MKLRLKPAQIAALVLLLCAAAIGLSRWRASRPFTAAALIECLPPDQSTHMYIDVATLRNSGLLDLLAGSKTAEEPDYRKFVDQSGFDYRTDLDAVAAAFFHGNVYFTLRGRFDWKRLSEYARAQGGSCRNSICTMPASKPDRYISFYPIKSDILALAIASQEHAVNMIGPNQWKTPPQLPAEPVWISAPSFAFTDLNELPSGARAFLSPLAQAQHAVFAVGPKDQRLQIRIEVACATPQDAAELTTKLSATTDLLKKMIEREHMTPNPRDLSGVLVAGTFQQQEKRVVGTWPIERGFVESLAAGKIQ
jgi:hypothetical protein